MKQLSRNSSVLLFILLTGVLIVVTFISYNKILLFNKSVDAMMHTNLMKNKIIEVVTNLKDAEGGQRGYILTKDSIFLKPYFGAGERNSAVFIELDSLTSGNEKQEQNLKKLKKLVDLRYKLLGMNLQRLKIQEPDSIVAATLNKGKTSMDEVSKQVAFMSKEENKLLLQRTQYKNRTAQIAPLFLLSLFLFAILIISFFFFRLQRETSERISITETNNLLKKTKKQIEASENQFRSFANNIQNLAWMANADGWVYWYNERWYEYTGTTLAEMQGWGWKKVHHKDHVDEVTALVEELWKKGEAFELQFPLRRFDGEYSWFLTRAYPVKDANGVVERWIGSNTDITDHKNISEELELQVQKRTKELQLQNKTFALAERTANFGSYKWNMTTGSLEYSDNFFRLLDCEPQEFVPTMDNFLTFIHPDDFEQVKLDGKLTLETGILSESPYRIVSKMGVIKHLRSCGNFSTEDGERFLIGTVQDISKDVAASKVLKEKNIELENANVELASFSYVASHDLQEPLRKIQGFSKRIVDKDGDKLSDTTKDYFARICSAALRMQNLIESLLTFSRTNLSEVEFEKTDLNQVLIDVQATLHHPLNIKNAVIESQTLPILYAVPIQMHQLFLNFITNSLKYAKPGVAPHIKITSELISINDADSVIERESDFWKITFSDNGIGFEQQYENKIFELFQRLHGKTEYEGTGIGLAICKKIIQTHNGTISASGQLGIGATFTFYLSANLS